MFMQNVQTAVGNNQMGIIGWIIVGAIAGWLASRFMGRGGYGLIGDIIVGIVGAFLGGWLLGLASPGFTMSRQNWWVTIPVAFAGAVIAMFIVRAVRPRRAFR